MTKIIIFDLDNTLSKSRSKISPSMSEILTKLLDKYEVAIISGGTLESIHFQAISELPKSAKLDKMTLLPASGTSCYRYEMGKLKEEYSYPITKSEENFISEAIKKVSTIEKPKKIFKPLIEFKGGQVTYSPLGVGAPQELKEAFDPDHTKREKIIAKLKKLLPEYKLGIGGLTSIDITKKGRDKSFGIKRILEMKNINRKDVVFIGDALYEGGNDLPACLPDMTCIRTKGPEDTENIVKDILNKNKAYSDIVAFFCMEYSLDDSKGTYAGGLGVLAGDYLLEMADTGVEVFAIGLYYSGYKGREDWSEVLDKDGDVLNLYIPISGKDIKVRIWKKKVGASVTMFLLDTDVDGNFEEDRQITADLYNKETYTRIKQQIILGIGGVMLLKKLNIKPNIYHLNEGHTAFAGLALMSEKKKEYKIVATKHTILPIGININKKDFKGFLSRYCEIEKLKINSVYNLGKMEKDKNLFSTTKFLLNVSDIKNGVSLSHTIFEKKIHPNSTLIPITNGVYTKRWLAPEWNGLQNKMSDESLWKVKNTLSENLFDYIEKNFQRKVDHSACTVVWARRFATYKRPLLLFSDVDRLSKIFANKEKPIQIIISGRVQKGDKFGEEVDRKLLEFSSNPMFRDNIIYLPDYSMEISKYLLQGAHVWLNTPEMGKEACGTSGIKSGLNGALQCSVADGWVSEVDWKNKGFVLSEEETAEDLYRYLEKDIPNLFYERFKGIPNRWIEYMRATIDVALSSYTTERMINDYIEKAYHIAD